jgi:bifunctional non-homologous end joining protein LigD
MASVPKRSPSQAVKATVAVPQFIPPQLTQLVTTAPSGEQWLHEIKLDG